MQYEKIPHNVIKLSLMEILQVLCLQKQEKKLIIKW
jgi:hypothetical protein